MTDTLAIYRVLSNRSLVKKIISKLPDRIIRVSYEDDRWRWKYNHYQTLSSILKTPYHSLILDKLKANSLVITGECILALVKSSDIDFKIFKAFYQLKQWMFTDEKLLFHAAESGSIDKVKQLAAQVYPVKLVRVINGKVLGDEMINIVQHAFSSLQFDVYEYLLYQTNITDIKGGKPLADATPKFKAQVLMFSIFELKDLNYLKRVANSKKCDSTGNRIENDLYQLKKEIMKVDPNYRSCGEKLLTREGGLHLMRVFFPTFSVHVGGMVDYLFRNNMDGYSDYQFEVLDYLGKVYSNQYQLHLLEGELLGSSIPVSQIARNQVKSSFLNLKKKIIGQSKSTSTTNSSNSQLQIPDADSLPMLNHLLILFRSIIILQMGQYNSLKCYINLTSDLIRFAGINGLPLVLELDHPSKNAQNYNVCRYGTLEQVRYTIKHYCETFGTHDIPNWLLGSMNNENPYIFRYLLEEYTLPVLRNVVNTTWGLNSFQIDTPEKLQLCLCIDPELKFYGSNVVQPKVLTKAYLLDLINLIKRNPSFSDCINFHRVTLDDYPMQSSISVEELYENKVEIIKILVKDFRSLCIPILKATLHSLHYQYVEVFIECDPTLLDEIADVIGYLGDNTLLDLVIGYLSSKQLQRIINYACRYGCLSMLDHCKQKYPERSTWKKSSDIIQLGRVDIIQYYLDHCQQSKEGLLVLLLEKSVIDGQLDIFKYLINHQLLSQEKRLSILNSIFKESTLAPLMKTQWCVPFLNYVKEIGGNIQ